MIRHLGKTDVIELVRVLHDPQVIREDLHYHSFTGPRWPHEKNVLVQLVILTGKHV